MIKFKVLSYNNWNKLICLILCIIYRFLFSSHTQHFDGPVCFISTQYKKYVSVFVYSEIIKLWKYTNSLFFLFLGIPPITAFEKNGLKIVFEFDKPPDNPHMIIINLIATNHSLAPIQDFLFQAAVPKVIFKVIKNVSLYWIAALLFLIFFPLNFRYFSCSCYLLQIMLYQPITWVISNKRSKS